MILSFPLELSNMSSCQQLCVVCFPIEEAYMVALCLLLWSGLKIPANYTHSKALFRQVI